MTLRHCARRLVKSGALACLAVLAITPALAGLSDPRYELQVGDIEVVNDGVNNGLYVRGSFSPTLPCPVQGFVAYAAEPYLKEVMAMLLTAKASGRAVSFVHVYCVGSGAAVGYSRGNGYVLK
jgi:hypothetical protein